MKPQKAQRARVRSRVTAGDFPIVGVGASAGGLEAFTSLLRHLDAKTGMAFVLIQHLDPTHTSFLCEALVRTTKMSVEQAEDGMVVLPNHVYVIPPNTWLGIKGGRLTLASRANEMGAQRVPHLPVDFFFGELALEKGSSAIGVVLSGNASDGTAGLKAIKEAGGITLAQEPRSAKFGGMPESAILAGVVDARLLVPELARELGRLSRHAYLTAREPRMPAPDAATLTSIFALVHEAEGVNLNEYKSPTLVRRIARRMALLRVDTLKAYLAVLAGSKEEVHALYEDALIHVTSFFRDPEVFESLKANVFPAIVKDKLDRAPLRIWVAGCATGEEVYSHGIALLEFLGESARPVQIFGSDVSAKAIETARAGFYPDNALRDVSDERRRRYFTKVEHGYRVGKSIRDLCVFVQHDIARDPPFSRVDVVSCRNVLIYFDLTLQKRVVPTLHYALRQPGFLVLGRAESISGWKQLFQVVDKTNKVFARTSVPSVLRFARQAELPRPEAPVGLRRPERERSETPSDISRRIDRMLLGRYAPPGIVVNDKLEILEFRGETGAYLRPAPGEPQSNAMKMARGGLAMTLRGAVTKAKKGGAQVRVRGVEVDQDGGKKVCDVVVTPVLGSSGAESPLFVVVFEERPRAPQRKTAGEIKEATRRRPRLEEELSSTKEYLQTVIAEHGRTNEDLGAANEELISGNEELQSMNEELETAKEELQSINEELTTVNDELHTRNHDVTQVNSDLVNLLTTVDIPILILDAERRIRRFTPKARRILNVVAADIGRPFDDIRPNINVPDLDAQIAEVIDTMVVKEAEVVDKDGHWHRLQIRPYKTTDNRIDGAILSLVDIDALKHHVTEAKLANAKAERASNAKDEFMATLSHELRTPLSSMLMRAQLLRRGGMDEAKVIRTGEAIEAGVNVQVRLIEDLLDISRIVSGKLHVELGSVDLTRVVTAAVESVSHTVERKSLRLDVDVSGDDGTRRVSGDTSRLQQVVTNLLGNAIKFTPARGTILVSLVFRADTAVIRVKDSGMGIEPAFLTGVFDRFAQESSTSTRAHSGLGLGLAIVRHIVELHRGTVVAESAGSGQGATFSVTLPLMKGVHAAVTSKATRALPHTPVDLAPLYGFRILVVDDDLATREAIADILARTGAVLRLADCAAEALRVVEDFGPQLLLCDIAMPGEDGYSFLRRLRALGVGRSGTVPALALTALAHDDDRDRALAAGFQMHIAKPVDIDRLTHAVLSLARSRATVSPIGAA